MPLQPEPLISLENVGITRSGRTILSGVNLTVCQGDFMAITGPNGGGKTTLLRILLRLLAPSEGSVVYSPNLKTVGYLPQKNRIDSMFPISVADVVASGLLSIDGIDKRERAQRVRDTLRLVGMESHSKSPIGAISGGQLQRTLLGRAIISNPSLLVMDEPLNFLDKGFESRIYEIIREFSTHSTIVLVSHEMNEIATMANRHIIVDSGVTECHCAHHRASITHCN